MGKCSEGQKASLKPDLLPLNTKYATDCDIALSAKGTLEEGLSQGFAIAYTLF